MTEDEIKAHEAALTQRLAAYPTIPCRRPVLRGTAATGSATHDMLAIEQASGAFATCLADLARLSAIDNLGKLADDRRPELVALEKTCGPLAEAVVTKAVAHEDACSPFQVGVRIEPAGAGFVTYFHVAHLLGLRARTLGERDAKAGLWLALDLARFGQDFARRTTMLNTMIGLAISEVAVEAARQIVDRRKLSRADLDAFAPVVDALIASHPPIGPTLAAEVDHFVLHVGMAPLQPATWQAPGGWPDGKRPPPAGKREGTELDPRDEAAMIFLVGAELRPKLAAACPDAGPLADCYRALAAHAKTPPDLDLAKLYADLTAKALASGSDPAAFEQTRLEIRAKIVEILTATIVGQYPQFAARQGAALARLASLQLHLEVQRAIARTRKCPGASELAAAPYARPVPRLGGALAVAVDGAAIKVTPPSWSEGGQPRPPYTITCP